MSLYRKANIDKLNEQVACAADELASTITALDDPLEIDLETATSSIMSALKVVALSISSKTKYVAAPLEPEITRVMQERFFDDGTFPPLKEMTTAVAQAKHPLEERPAPFARKPLPMTTLSTMAYGQRLASWMQRVQQEDEIPTAEQLTVLNRVADRVLEEFRLEKEGLL